MHRFALYKQLMCPEAIRLVDRGDACAVQFDWLLAHAKEPALLVDLCFAWVLSVGRRGTGHPLHPKRVELGYEDANSVFRAFHHWEGTSPGQWQDIRKKPHPALKLR